VHLKRCQERRILVALIDWGRLGAPSGREMQQLTLLLDVFRKMCRATSHYWYEMTRGLTSQQSVNLVKGLVLAQNRWRVDSGNVSPVIWVFKLLRRQMDTRELADWVIERTRNPYEPFGMPRIRTPCRLRGSR
jgi:hypothetical protein